MSRWITPAILLILVSVVAITPCTAADQLTADFTAQDSFTHGVAPFTATFQDRSILAASWLWDFGDGQSSTQSSPEHTYANPGTYTVTLTVHDVSGTLSSTKTIPDYIVIAPDPMGASVTTVAPAVPVSTTIPPVTTVIPTYSITSGTTTLPTTTATPSRSGTISITSSPAGALVLLDGIEQGMTPMTLYTIPVGEHIVTVHDKGYTDNQTEVQVEDQKQVKLDVVLLPVGFKVNPTVTVTEIEETTAAQKAVAIVSTQTVVPTTGTGSIHVYCNGCLGLLNSGRPITDIQYDAYIGNTNTNIYHNYLPREETLITGLQPGPYAVQVIPNTYIHQTLMTTVQPGQESVVTFKGPTFAKSPGFEAVLVILAFAGIAGIRRFRP